MLKQFTYYITHSKSILLTAGMIALMSLLVLGANGKGKVMKSDAEWKQILTPLQFKVMRKGGTEAKGTGKYLRNKKKGIYTCAGCGLELFRSTDKFNSGSGWPSFSKSHDKRAIKEKRDRSLGMVRTELLCSRCNSHLGHVFKDGPKPTGLRYCINSVSLNFKKTAPVARKTNSKFKTATLGTGCFWCTEALFNTLDGIKSVTVGYMGGHVEKPTYEQVCSGRTGHAEVAQIVYDPKKTSFDKLLNLFWKIHDPTSLNRQGADIGTQYRSAIFYHSNEQKTIAQKSMSIAQKKIKKRIVTKLVPATCFYPALDYHQNYYARNPNAPYCRAVIAPKLKKAAKNQH